MRKKRGILFQIFVLFWSVLFLGGIYIVFLFLNGYSFFETRVLKKGYVSFSSESPLFLNGEYLHSYNFYGQREVGEYVLCIDDFSKKSQCYGGVEVGENDKVSQSLNNLYALGENESEYLFPLSNEGDFVVFSPNENSVLWYDKALRQIFYVSSASRKMESYFPNFPVVSVVFNEKKFGFDVLGETESFFVRVLPPVDHRFGMGIRKSDFAFSDFLYEKHSRSESFFEKMVTDIKGSYASALYSQCDIGKGRHVLFFDTSVYLFSQQMEHFSFLSSKDRDTKVVCSGDDESVYFMKNGRLVKRIF